MDLKFPLSWKKNSIVSPLRPAVPSIRSPSTCCQTLSTMTNGSAQKSKKAAFLPTKVGNLTIKKFVFA